MSTNLFDTHIQSLYGHLLDLSSEIGINASGRDDVYGCLFGRDSALTIISILQALSSDTEKKIDHTALLAICKQTLLTLVELQGQTVNIESGEEPGKFIHEYRTTGIERVTIIDDSNRDWLKKPWYVYPDNSIKNYDSIDSTPLALIAIYHYWKLTGDGEFLLRTLPAVEKGLNWMITYGDRDKDYLVEYELHDERKHGGLPVQSWTDSHESMMQEGKMPSYPIAPVEAQGYVWLALNVWADYYMDASGDVSNSGQFAQKLRSQAKHMKEMFNRLFIFSDQTSKGMTFVAQALDGEKNQLRTVTGNPLLLLWATHEPTQECILDEKYIQLLVTRSFQSDLFDPEAGIRTMSMLAPTYNPKQDSYHNGSFWPVLNGLAYEGLRKWKYSHEASSLKEASLKAYLHFGLPIELYMKSHDGVYTEFCGPDGQQSCKVQAWSAAAFLHMLVS